MGCNTSQPQAVGQPQLMVGAAPTIVMCGGCGAQFTVVAPPGTSQDSVIDASCPRCMQTVRFGTSQAAHAMATSSAQRTNHQSEAQQLVQLLPVEAYDAGQHKDLAECEICLEEYKNGEELKRLPCMHIFHSKCIESWLATESVCPNCRTDFCDAIKAASNPEAVSAQGSAALASVPGGSAVPPAA